MKEIIFYTDGSVYPNPGGMGGWAFVGLGLDGPDMPYEQKGWMAKATNNRAELVAVIQALLNVPVGRFVTIVTDSQYVQRCCARKSWPRTKPNWDLGVGLRDAMRGRFVEVRLVAGHSGDKWNDRAHELANQARLEGLDCEKRIEREYQESRRRSGREHLDVPTLTNFRVARCRSSATAVYDWISTLPGNPSTAQAR